MGLSNNAKFFCMLGGMAVAACAATWFRVEAAAIRFTDVPESMPRFDKEQQDEWRESARTRLIRTLESGTAYLCDPEQHRNVRFAVGGYFDQRAKSLVVAKQHLSPNEQERNRRAWDNDEGRQVENMVVTAARNGLISRADFQPVLPELAALIDKGKPVKSICEK